MTAGLEDLPQIEKSRWLVALGLIRAVATTAVLVALYYLLPLDSLSRAPWGLTFAVALTILVAVGAWQVRAVMASPNPAIRAIEGLAATAPLFILLFAATYFVMARTEPGHFSAPGMSRTDTLYFAVTIFSTVGFGDITATSAASRLVVTLQMVLDLIVLGLGVRVFAGAVRLGRERANGGPRAAEPKA